LDAPASDLKYENRFSLNPFLLATNWSCAMKNTNGRIVETAVEARGGRLGRPVLVVLIVSTCLAVGLLAIFYVGYFAK
jgi:hypothetical protein